VVVLKTTTVRALIIAFTIPFLLICASGQQVISSAQPRVVIPRVDRAPQLEEFIGMTPPIEWQGKLAKVDNFIQRDPRDGSPALQKTEVYMGYDSRNLYVIWLCFDEQPHTVRARMTRRENIGPEDDEVQLYLDTFNDQRRAYGFMTNPRGVQFDYLWTEERTYDASFDTLWYSEGRPTERGWIASMTIPFKSLRFRSNNPQTWGILLQRVVPRTGENLFWPKVTKSIGGRLTQEGLATGLGGISPGRNWQFIPYGVLRSFRAPDTRFDPPRFSGADLKGDIGLDAKFVIKDSFVLDLTANPDFSQVESDEPQVTVNQRFEVFFPEKRPFFLENASFFQTPINLLFTRRIADPSFGVRLTGRTGPYAVGALVTDDEAPGKSVVPGDELEGQRAYFGIFRASRDLWKGSHIGLMFTDREFEGSADEDDDDALRSRYNRVGGVDTRLKFGKNYTAELQAVTSSTRFADRSYEAGPAYNVFLQRDGRHLYFDSLYLDISPGFVTQPGFINRRDFRRFSNFGRYSFRPEGKYVTAHGPQLFQLHLWDHAGTPLERFLNGNYFVELPRITVVGAFANKQTEILRPQDLLDLDCDPAVEPRCASRIDLGSSRRGFFIESRYFPQLTVASEFGWGTQVNFIPPTGQAPFTAGTNFIVLFASVKPFMQLTIDNTYLLTRLRNRPTKENIFNNHIIRSKWNYQFTKELSLRFIAQYNTVLPNPLFTALERQKSFNADFLITYFLHPGTAIYVGYNSNLANPDPTLPDDIAPPDRFINDAKQVFVKASYLFRF
jgi:hypothetical protein